ncbi:metallophosphoesterase [Flavobacterium zepuense]|uniref:Metallophosphoesterase n=1 Tax=Flavobacterium zepuense TaxID=2593302 RepID=A0A552V0M8_9FLAO|nr:metallophosphoesterase [Flavobacterium zepuense]TRW24000.1 metallophosphoesterase [Flavobacterium zepuense]
MRTAYSFLILFALFSTALKAQKSRSEVQVAFLADVHLQDLYGTPEDNDYKGVLNPKNNKPTLLRTMDAQLHSTRIFNENYFAFLAALDDIAKRGVRYVALPGDYTDDGQPLHLKGLARILKEYSTKYSIEFFITTGNHDPVGPFAQDAGKDDFLGTGGKRQPIFSKEGLHKQDPATELPTIITKDIAKMGYLGVTDYLGEFGFLPKQVYKFWGTPFSTYTSDDYSLDKAKEAAKLSNRMYDVAPGFTVPDVSYVVEPVEGLWLLAIDGNVYIPKNANGDASDPKNYKGADLGYNNVLTNKKHIIEWVTKIAAEAKQKRKTLIAFSHYPIVEFNDDASPEIEALMGKGKWQLDRVPQEEVAQAFADAGIKLHFGGHMHINDTGIRTSQKGNTLINVQTPSLAAYIPAYKLLTLKSNNIAEVETIAIDNVPRFDELFELYKMEHQFLKSQNAKDIWDNAILKTKSYHEFTDYHLKELVRLRFIPDDWPTGFKEFLTRVSGYDLILIANSEGIALENFMNHKNDNVLWKNAEAKAKSFTKYNKITLNDYKKWTGLDLITDFYRIRSADQLVVADVGSERIKQYQALIVAFEQRKPNPDDTLQNNLGLFLTILDKFLNGAPADHFTIDLQSGKVIDLRK